MNRTRNAFGIEPRHVNDHAAARAIANRAALAAQVDAIHAKATREAAIAVASGRWRPGRPDPDTYRPGDVVALRSLSVTADLLHLRHNLAVLDAIPVNHVQRELQLHAAASTILTLDELRTLFDAVPHWLDATTAAGILDSTPPTPDVLTELRLPYPRILVCFERGFELPAELADWPQAWDHTPRTWDPSRRRTAIGDIRALGGALEGVVLTEIPGGGVRDEVLWLVSANPDPSLPMPLSLDRYRAFVWGRLRSARLAHVAHNLAAAVCWAEWRQPSRVVRLPEDVESRLWRKAVRRGEFRRHEPTGAAAGVRVIDLKRSPIQAGARSTDPHPDGTRRPPATHLRRAHWRHQPVGPGRTQRRLVRVAATVVNPGAGPPDTPVYRIPLPDEPTAGRSHLAEPTVADPPVADVIDLRTLPLRDRRPEPPLPRNDATPEVGL